MKLKINKVPGYNGVVNIETDFQGTPKLLFWRRRLQDAKIDNCVEIIKEKPKKATKNETKN